MGDIVNFSGGVKNKEEEKDFAAKTTKIAQDVISHLEQEDIPIFPDSFESVFEKMITDESEEFKNIVGQKADIVLEAKDRLLSFESGVKDGIKNVKSILDITKSIYQNVLTTQNIVRQKSQELAKIDNPVAFKSAVQLCFQDFENLQSVLEGQIVEMKEAFEKIVINIDNINKNSIYDTQYNVYNKRYFVSLCEKEKRLLDQIDCPYAFVSYSLTKGFLENLKDKNLIKMSLKAMARVLSQESRSDEILCYFGNGKFVVLCKYVEGEKVLERVKKMLSVAKENNLVLNNEQITLDFCAGICFPLKDAQLKEEIEQSINACDEAFNGMLDIQVKDNPQEINVEEKEEEQ